MRAVWVAALAATLTACGGAYQQVGAKITRGATSVLDDPVERKKIDDAGAEAAKAAAGGAADVLQERLPPIIESTLTLAGQTTRTQVGYLAGDLRSHVRLLGSSLDEVLVSPEMLAAIDALRERLVGQPLRDDGDKLAASLGASVGASMGQAFNKAIATVRPSIDAEASKWKPIAIGFGVGAGALLLMVIILVWTVRGHRQIIERLAGAPRLKSQV
jgi:hypothetical protein